MTSTQSVTQSQNLDRLFRAGELYILRIRWRTGLRLRLSAEDVGADPDKAYAEAVRLGYKSLFSEEMLEPLRKAESAARNSHARLSFPFPSAEFQIGGRFVPLTAKERLERELEEAHAEFAAAWDAFTDPETYRRNRDEMIQRNPSLLSADNYPDPSRLSYTFDWIPVTLTPSGQEAAEKVRSAVDEFTRDVVGTMREEVTKACREHAERLATGKPISERSLNALRGMVERFTALNFTGDPVILRTLDRLRTELSLRTAKEVREDDDARIALKRVLDLVADDAAKKDDVDTVAGAFLGRVIQLEPEASTGA